MNDSSSQGLMLVFGFLLLVAILLIIYFIAKWIKSKL